uniref:Uncharacterized protein n=1 Tax=Rhizophora mucronata TaxID=61149 RepID=A0A2P2NBD9_RHIMU
MSSLNPLLNLMLNTPAKTTFQDQSFIFPEQKAKTKTQKKHKKTELLIHLSSQSLVNS